MLKLIVSSALAVSGVTAAQAQAPSEIYIDGKCRVYTQPLPSRSNPAPKPKFHFDDQVCHFETEHTSSRWEYKANPAGIPKGSFVTIVEHEYVLWNPLPYPVTFVVGQYVPKGWVIDSDPQPGEITNSLAMFRVNAEPNQTIRLHVGAKQ